MTYFSRQSPQETRSILVGFIGIDGVSSFDLSSSLEPFAAARQTSPTAESQRCYETIIVGVDRKTFVCDSGAVMRAQYTMRDVPLLDTIIIPGGRSLRNSDAAKDFVAWLSKQAQATRRIAAVGAGIYPLARTGLLKGSHVTTHWRLAHDVAQTFPELSVHSAVSFLKCEQYYTCGGGVSAMEMSLALIEEDYGAKTAYAVARELSIDVRPPGGEQQVVIPEYQAGVLERLAELPAWMTSRLHRDLTVQVLAERAGLSQRHFHRLFKQTFKSSPAAFVEQLRINEAQQRLAAKRDSVENIASAVGFKSSGVFRRAFGRQRGFSPGTVLKDRPSHRVLPN